MRTYLATVGFDSRRVTRPTLNHGIDEGDEVVLIRPAKAPEDRAKEAITDIKQFFKEVDPEIGVTQVQINHEEMHTAVLECVDLVQAAEGERIVCLCGGARDVLLPLTVATLSVRPLLDTVLFFSDIDSAVEEWTLPALEPTLPESLAGTFQLITDSESWISLSALADQTDASKSTITRHVTKLEERSLVNTRTVGREKEVRASFTGRLAAR